LVILWRYGASQKESKWEDEWSIERKKNQYKHRLPPSKARGGGK